MKLTLDIKDSKAAFAIELLRNLSFVKVETLTHQKATFIKELKGSVEEVKLAKKARKAENC
jgi:hypothetical protein